MPEDCDTHTPFLVTHAYTKGGNAIHLWHVIAENINVEVGDLQMTEIPALEERAQDVLSDYFILLFAKVRRLNPATLSNFVAPRTRTPNAPTSTESW